jgi:hypothetical protein
VALVFGARAFDAQQLERNVELRAVIEGDVQRFGFAIEREIGGPGRAHSSFGPSSRASSISMIGTPSRTG